MTTRNPTTLLFLLLAACDVSARAATPTPEAVEVSEPASVGMPRLDASEIDALVGRVERVLPAGHYTYLEISAEDAPRWAVVLGSPTLERGDYVDLAVYGYRQDFPSRRLDRTFDALFFGRIRSAA